MAQQVCNVHHSTQQVTVYNRSSTCTYVWYVIKKLPQVHESFSEVQDGLTVSKPFMKIIMCNNKRISTSAMSN